METDPLYVAVRRAESRLNSARLSLENAENEHKDKLHAVQELGDGWLNSSTGLLSSLMIDACQNTKNPVYK